MVRWPATSWPALSSSCRCILSGGHSTRCALAGKTRPRGLWSSKIRPTWWVSSEKPLIEQVTTHCLALTAYSYDSIDSVSNGLFGSRQQRLPAGRGRCCAVRGDRTFDSYLRRRRSAHHRDFAIRISRATDGRVGGPSNSNHYSEGRQRSGAGDYARCGSTRLRSDRHGFAWTLGRRPVFPGAQRGRAGGPRFQDSHDHCPALRPAPHHAPHRSFSADRLCDGFGGEFETDSAAGGVDCQTDQSKIG